MAPSSLGYISFAVTAAGIHRLLPGRMRNVFLLIASWCFYLMSAPKLFEVYLLTSSFSYVLTLGMKRFPERRKLLLIAGLVVNIGILFLCKYLSFFAMLLQRVGVPKLELPPLVQPLGLSFYTFTLTGYLIDAYRGKAETGCRYHEFALFVGFFPAILSGPIGRSAVLLPQIREHASCRVGFEDVKAAITRFLVGLGKKMLLANQLGILVDTVYAAPQDYSGAKVALAMIAYALQIYCDFSAYSDMAIGTGRLFGIQLSENFDAPYLSASVQNFWRRWHMSLTGWFRDYLYIPLGGSRKGKLRNRINVLVVFAVSGLWHGAAMKFVIWGALNGLYQVAESQLRPVGKRIRELIPTQWGQRIVDGIGVLVTFVLVTLAWVFFRADSTSHALELFRQLAVPGTLFPLVELGLTDIQFQRIGTGIVCVFVWDFVCRKHQAEQRLNETVFLRWVLWTALLLAILCFGAYGTGYNADDFIYFRF